MMNALVILLTVFLFEDSLAVPKRVKNNQHKHGEFRPKPVKLPESPEELKELCGEIEGNCRWYLDDGCYGECGIRVAERHNCRKECEEPINSRLVELRTLCGIPAPDVSDECLWNLIQICADCTGDMVNNLARNCAEECIKNKPFGEQPVAGYPISTQ